MFRCETSVFVVPGIGSLLVPGALRGDSLRLNFGG